MDTARQESALVPDANRQSQELAPMKGPIHIWAITPNGLETAKKLFSCMENTCLFVSERLASQYPVPESSRVFTSLSQEIKRGFHQACAHIFIASTGIVVRVIASHLVSKLSDPAVVVLDDRACHAISLVSGHLGGGNELTRSVAAITGAIPVITTATDVNQLPAIDMIAKRLGLFIETPEAIKTINMAFLETRPISIVDPFRLLSRELPDNLIDTAFASTSQTAGPPDIVCSDTLIPVPRGTLILRPPTLAVGIGCNRGTACQEITQVVTEVFADHNLSLQSVSQLATTQVKHDEQGLLAFARTLSLPVIFYTNQQLNTVKTIENPSAMVEKHLGVKSVCEAAAILAATNGSLIVPKVIKGNVTVAVARKDPGSLSSG